MALTKIDAMHHFYGFGTGQCKDCPHFIRKVWDRTFNKCTVYGDSNSAATDWRLSYQACGLIDKPFPEDDVRIVKRVTRSFDDKPLPWQIDMFGDKE